MVQLGVPIPWNITEILYLNTKKVQYFIMFYHAPYRHVSVVEVTLLSFLLSKWSLFEEYLLYCDIGASVYFFFFFAGLDDYECLNIFNSLLLALFVVSL